MTLLDKPMSLKPPGKAVGPEIHTGVTSADTKQRISREIGIDFLCTFLQHGELIEMVQLKGEHPNPYYSGFIHYYEVFLQEYHGKIIDR